MDSASIDEIIDGFLFLGNTYAAISAPIMASYQITHILSISTWADSSKFINEQVYTHRILNLQDDPQVDISSYLVEVFQFIESCKEKKGRIFIHCRSGDSRSAAFVIAYLMKSNQMSYETAFECVKIRRSSVQPNEGFKRSLLGYEATLFGRQMSGMAI